MRMHFRRKIFTLSSAERIFGNAEIFFQSWDYSFGSATFSGHSTLTGFIYFQVSGREVRSSVFRLL